MGYERSIAELEEFYLTSDAALGSHAQCIDGDGGTSVWDEERIERVHAAKRTWAHQEAIRKRDRVERALSRVSPEGRGILEAAWESWGEGRTSSKLRGAMLRRGSNVCLIGLAIKTEAARAMFKRCFPKLGVHEPVVILRFLEYEAGKNAKLNVIRDAADALLDRALDEYETARQARNRVDAEHRMSA